MNMGLSGTVHTHTLVPFEMEEYHAFGEEKRYQVTAYICPFCGEKVDVGEIPLDGGESGV